MKTNTNPRSSPTFIELRLPSSSGWDSWKVLPVCRMRIRRNLEIVVTA